MTDDYFQNPKRFPGNVDGPFYTTRYQCHETDKPDSPLVWCGDCLWCEAPEHEAPDLLAPLNADDHNTYFVRQPSSPEEVERACLALSVCCVAALRYGGKDPAIIRRLNNDTELCDYTIDDSGNLKQVVDDDGNFFPFAWQQIIARRVESEKQRKKP